MTWSNRRLGFAEVGLFRCTVDAGPRLTAAAYCFIPKLGAAWSWVSWQTELIFPDPPG